jgi:hypothetical protein
MLPTKSVLVLASQDYFVGMLPAPFMKTAKNVNLSSNFKFSIKVYFIRNKILLNNRLSF